MADVAGQRRGGHDELGVVDDLVALLVAPEQHRVAARLDERGDDEALLVEGLLERLRGPPAIGHELERDLVGRVVLPGARRERDAVLDRRRERVRGDDRRVRVGVVARQDHEARVQGVARIADAGDRGLLVDVDLVAAREQAALFEDRARELAGVGAERELDLVGEQQRGVGHQRLLIGGEVADRRVRAVEDRRERVLVAEARVEQRRADVVHRRRPDPALHVQLARDVLRAAKRDRDVARARAEVQPAEVAEVVVELRRLAHEAGEDVGGALVERAAVADEAAVVEPADRLAGAVAPRHVVPELVHEHLEVVGRVGVGALAHVDLAVTAVDGAVEGDRRALGVAPAHVRDDLDPALLGRQLLPLAVHHLPHRRVPAPREQALDEARGHVQRVDGRVGVLGVSLGGRVIPVGQRVGELAELAGERRHDLRALAGLFVPRALDHAEHLALERERRVAGEVDREAVGRRRRHRVLEPARDRAAVLVQARGGGEHLAGRQRHDARLGLRAPVDHAQRAVLEPRRDQAAGVRPPQAPRSAGRRAARERRAGASARPMTCRRRRSGVRRSARRLCATGSPSQNSCAITSAPPCASRIVTARHEVSACSGSRPRSRERLVARRDLRPALDQVTRGALGPRGAREQPRAHAQAGQADHHGRLYPAGARPSRRAGPRAARARLAAVPALGPRRPRAHPTGAARHHPRRDLLHCPGRERSSRRDRGGQAS
ncbi:MAG: hypothetical protein H6713_33590 [Myxococcales bacterium]|nr:hypothetical protein [Myxococcales bacterium]